MLLCRCMNLDKKCPHQHWSDLTPEQQAEYNATVCQDMTEVVKPEDKKWPPTNMENK